MEEKISEELKMFLAYARAEGVTNKEISDKLEKFLELYIERIR